MIKNKKVSYYKGKGKYEYSFAIKEVSEDDIELLQNNSEEFWRGVDEIGTSAFVQLEGLETIEIPDSVRTIGLDAFRDCKNLRLVKFPARLKEIGMWAFEGCSALESVDVESCELERVGATAFNNCTALKTVNMPNLTALEVNTFANCQNLQTVRVPSCKVIGAFCFDGCESLKEIEFSQELHTIGHRAFQHCRALDEIILPQELNTIEVGAFFGSGLKHIVIPKTVQVVKKEAFAYCPDLLSIKICGNYTQYEYESFWGCPNLEAIYMPKSKTPAEIYFTK